MHLSARFVPWSLISTLWIASTAAAQCSSEWSDGYSSSRLGGVPAGTAVYDAGDGPRLFFSGSFSTRVVTESGLRDSVIGFNGTDIYVPGNPPLGGEATALAVFDDGDGPSLIALHEDRVWSFRDDTWTVLPGVFAQPPGVLVGPRLITAITFDDGSGEALYVGGDFRRIDGELFASVAKYDGMGWSNVGLGLELGEVLDLHVHDFGAGPELVAAGMFTQTGGAPIEQVARWTGTQWTSVGLAPRGGPVRALTSWNDGTQNLLVAGGRFGEAGSGLARRIAAFDGTSWSALGNGVGFASGGNNLEIGVYCLLSEPSPGGRLVVGGIFDEASGVSVGGVAAWDGTTWSELGTGIVPESGPLEVMTLTSVVLEGEERVVAGGRFEFEEAAGSNAAVLDGTTWRRLAEDGLGFYGSRTNDGVLWDDGQGESLYVAGRFERAGRVMAENIVRRDSQGHWESIAEGLEPAPQFQGILQLLAHDGPLRGSNADASGVYALGSFYVDSQFTQIARFDGTQWHAVSPFQGEIDCITIFDDGQGPRLFAGGTNRLLAIDGAGSESFDLTTSSDLSHYELRSLAAYQGQLYLQGFLLYSGLDLRGNLGRWDGSAFHPVDFAPWEMNTGSGEELVVFDPGSGPRLWCSIGGLVSLGPDGFSLHPFDPVTQPGNFVVKSFAVMERPGLPDQLVLGGQVANDGGRVRIFGEPGEQRFDREVTALFSGRTLDGRSAVYAGGSFRTRDRIQSALLAELSVSCETGSAYCFGDGELSPGCTPCPCGNEALSGSRSGCINMSGQGSRLVASGASSSSDDTLRFEVVGMPESTSAFLFSGANRLPANPSNPCFGLDTGVATAGDGLRCMGGNAVRHGARFSDDAGVIGQTNNGWGGSSPPGVGLLAQAGFSAGQTHHFQVIHRDAPASGCGTGINSTQGVSIVVEP